MAMKPVSVSQLNAYVKRILQSDPLLGNVSVVGEVSNLKYHSSGHVYFTLKDQQSKLNCFLAADRLPFLRHQLAEGMEVTAVGYLSVFERGGTYSLNIRDISVEGQGNLALAFEKLKEKLAAEGLFDQRYKKPLPSFPRQVAVITSETGAAVRDIIKVIRNRNTIVEILVYPCLVQGPGAAAEIAAAIAEVNRLFPGCDLIITGRGGGSAEELWAFNEEVVARSIFLSEIPVISAVGHETDFTIADFVADRRAETPTAAAQMAAPDIQALRRQVAAGGQELRRAMEQCILLKEGRVFRRSMEALQLSLLDRIKNSAWTAERLRQEMSFAVEKRLADGKNRMEQGRLQLEALDPLRVLDRGFAVLRGPEGKIIGSAAAVSAGDRLTVVLKDGKLLCTADEVRRSENGEKQ